MPSKTNKQSLKKNHKQNIVPKIKGGAVSGVGTFGVVVSKPAIPVYIPRNTQRPNTQRPNTQRPNTPRPNTTLFSRLKTTIKSKLSKNNKLVSKLFFDEQEIEKAIKSIEFLKEAAGSETIEAVFGKYLFLPYKQIDGRYVADINISEYLGPKFQNERYWRNVNPRNTGDYVSKTALRDSLKGATQQIQYLNATCGSLDDLEIGTFKDFNKFLVKFKNIVNGITLLHSKELVHHDLKPANILCKTIMQKRYYLISDLDTICPVDKFNINELHSNNNFNISRLLENWTYDYWPSCITLLNSCLMAKKDIISDNASIYYSILYINTKLLQPDNYISKCHNTFKYLIQGIRKIIPDSTIIQGYLNEIFKYRYGSDTIDEDIMDTINGILLKKNKDALVANNKQIADLISNRGLSINEIRNILLKYVDIYSLCMSIINMVNNFLDKSIPRNLEMGAIISQFFNKLFLFLSICMTNQYFKMQIFQFPFRNDGITIYDNRYLYEVPITKLYDSLLLHLADTA